MAANDFVYASTALPGDIACKNTEASTAIAAGNVVYLDSTNVVSSTQAVPGVKVATNNAYPLGVAMEAIAVGATGRVRPVGIAQVVSSAAVTAGAIVQSSGSGKVATQSAGQPQLGQALTTTAADGDKLLVLISLAKNA